MATTTGDRSLASEFELIWKEIHGIEEPLGSRSFVELGGTSIIAELLAARIRETFGVPFKGLEVLRLDSFEQILAAVELRLVGEVSSQKGESGE